MTSLELVARVFIAALLTFCVTFTVVVTAIFLWRKGLTLDGDAILFFLTCIMLGVLIAYVVITHMPAYWCGGTQ